MADHARRLPNGETRYVHLTSGQERLMAKMRWEQTVRTQQLRDERRMLAYVSSPGFAKLSLYDGRTVNRLVTKGYLEITRLVKESPQTEDYVVITQSGKDALDNFYRKHVPLP